MRSVLEIANFDEHVFALPLKVLPLLHTPFPLPQPAFESTSSVLEACRAQQAEL